MRNSSNALKTVIVTYKCAFSLLSNLLWNLINKSGNTIWSFDTSVVVLSVGSRLGLFIYISILVFVETHYLLICSLVSSHLHVHFQLVLVSRQSLCTLTHLLPCSENGVCSKQFLYFFSVYSSFDFKALWCALFACMLAASQELLGTFTSPAPLPNLSWLTEQQELRSQIPVSHSQVPAVT